MVIDTFLVTCEHGGNRVPATYRSLFYRHRLLLNSHRGFDAGALVMARTLARALDAPIVAATISRLVIDLNRSLGHPQLFSAATRTLPAALREEIVAQYYRPYRDLVEQSVRLAVNSGRRVIHLSSHSFTPELNGTVRRADVGLLYHPGRPGEVALCARWKASLAAVVPTLRVRRNYPYAGKGDGMTSHLRRHFPPSEYVGIELEVNQGIVCGGGRQWTALRRGLIDSLHTALSI